MKKLIILLLVAVMCLSFVACGGGSGSAKKEIVGEWKCPDSGYSITFNEDGTGIDPDDGDLTWKYDSELSCYTAASSEYGRTISVTIKTTDDGLRYINIGGYKYYHSDDYDKGFELEIAEEKEFINESIINTKTKIEFGKTYDYKEGISVKFTNATIEEGFLYLNAQLTNTTTNLLDFYIMNNLSGYFVKRTVGYNQISSDNFWRIGYKSIIEIPAGESLDLKLRLHKDITNTKNINYFYVYFSMNNVEYYMDLTECFK